MQYVSHQYAVLKHKLRKTLTNADSALIGFVSQSARPSSIVYPANYRSTVTKYTVIVVQKHTKTSHRASCHVLVRRVHPCGWIRSLYVSLKHLC